MDSPTISKLTKQLEKQNILFEDMFKIVDYLSEQIPIIEAVDIGALVWYTRLNDITIKSDNVVTFGDDKLLTVSWGCSEGSVFSYLNYANKNDFVSEILSNRPPFHKNPFEFKTKDFTKLIDFLERFTFAGDSDAFKIILSFKEVFDSIIKLNTINKSPIKYENENENAELSLLAKEKELTSLVEKHRIK